jgi:predicted transcriptional regulator
LEEYAASSFKQQIENIAGEKAPGPSTTFSVFHLFYAVELMTEKPIGRNRLAEKLEVGEGAIRTIISRLRDAGLITSAKEGCSLTEKGANVWKKFEEIFPQRSEIERTELTNASHNYGFLVKASGNKVKSGIEQRDAAIIAGAERATVIVSRHGHLSIESVSDDIGKDFPKATSQIVKDLKPEDSDVIILAGADTVLKAMRGAFAAGWSLVDGEKKNR